MFVKVIMIYIFSCDILFWYFFKKFHPCLCTCLYLMFSLLYNIPLYYRSTVLSALLFTRVGIIVFRFHYWRQCCCGHSAHLQCKLCVPCLYSVLRTWLTHDRYSINVWGMWCFLYPSPCMCSSSRTAVLKSLNICSHDATEPFVPFTAFHSVRIVLACGQARMCVLWIFKSPL